MKIGFLGPIAVGKSSISWLVAQATGSVLMEEPVVKSRYLPLFYSDPKRFALVAQNQFYSDLTYDMLQVEDNENVIYDSTIFSNLVFAELLHEEGLMTKEELGFTYQIALAHLKIVGHIDKYIILRRSKEMLFKNQQMRSREIEKGQEEYLNFHYDHYYEAVDKVLKHFPDVLDRIEFVELGDIYYEEHNIKELVDKIIK